MLDTKRLIIFVIAFVALIGIVAALFALRGAFASRQANTAPPYVAPPPSQLVVEKLEKSRGFQALVSYTNRGFEPADITIDRGATIRFTNNSAENLRITTIGKVYPGRSPCNASSALDSCETLAPKDFWEFTFTTSGIWTYENAADKAKQGAIRVR